MKRFILFSLILLISQSLFSQQLNIVCKTNLMPTPKYRPDIYMPTESDPTYKYVKAQMIFKNNYNKTIVGVKFECIFKNVFQEVLHSFSGESFTTIPPNSEKIDDKFYWWEDAFMNNAIFNKLKEPVKTKNINTTIKIKSIAFRDGSIINF